jgi:YVTN family beta-propeller protein
MTTSGPGFVQKKLVTVGAAPHHHLGYARWADRVVVLNTDNTVTLLDGATGEPVARVELPGLPTHVYMDATTKLGYVALDSDVLALLDPSTAAVVGKVKLAEGTGRTLLLPMPPRQRVYVLSEHQQSMQVVDTKSFEVVGAIPVGKAASWGQPHEKPCGKYYVSNAGSNDVTVIDDETEKVIATLPAGERPERSAIFREQGLVYTGDVGSNTVTAVSIEKDTVVATIPVGTWPFRLIGMEKKTGRPELWVLNRGPNGVSGDISVVNAPEHTVTSTLRPVESPVNWLFKGPIVHVVSDAARELVVMDTRSLDIIDTVQLPAAPDPDSLSNMVFSESGNLFLANAEDSVTVFEPKS